MRDVDPHHEHWEIVDSGHFTGMDCTVERTDETQTGTVVAIWRFRGGNRSGRCRRQRARRGWRTDRQHRPRSRQLWDKCLTCAPIFMPEGTDTSYSQDRSHHTRIATRLRTREFGTFPCSAAGHLKLSPTRSGSSVHRIGRRRGRDTRLCRVEAVNTTEPALYIQSLPRIQPRVSEVAR